MFNKYYILPLNNAILCGGMYFLVNILLKHEKEMEVQKQRIREIRKTVDSLTTEAVVHLNKINRILTEVEQTLFAHPDLENYALLK